MQNSENILDKISSGFKGGLVFNLAIEVFYSGG